MAMAFRSWWRGHATLLENRCSHACIHTATDWPIHLNICMPTSRCPSPCLSDCLFVCLSMHICLYVCLSVFLCMCILVIGLPEAHLESGVASPSHGAKHGPPSSQQESCLELHCFGSNTLLAYSSTHLDSSDTLHLRSNTLLFIDNTSPIDSNTPLSTRSPIHVDGSTLPLTGDTL